MTVHTVAAGRPPVGMSQKDHISWYAVTSPQTLKFNGTSKVDVARALIEAFGAFPIRLESDRHLEMLRAMAAVAGEGKAPYVMLASGLQQFGIIEVVEK